LKRIAHLVLIVALLNATGMHWAMLQSVAWATMLANHARTESLTDAISQTFDGQHPCPLCRQIAKSRQAQNKADLQTAPQKLEFSNDLTAYFITPPTRFFLLSNRNSFAALLTQTPPTPPPRQAAA
jgi:hypothetical protein